MKTYYLAFIAAAALALSACGGSEEKDEDNSGKSPSASAGLSLPKVSEKGGVYRNFFAVPSFAKSASDNGGIFKVGTLTYTLISQSNGSWTLKLNGTADDKAYANFTLMSFESTNASSTTGVFKLFNENTEKVSVKVTYKSEEYIYESFDEQGNVATKLVYVEKGDIVRFISEGSGSNGSTVLDITEASVTTYTGCTATVQTLKTSLSSCASNASSST